MRQLEDELVRLARCPLLVIDEGGYTPFEPEGVSLLFPDRLQPVRTRLPDRHQQQAIRPGRSPRRRDDPRRRHDPTGSSTTPKSSATRATVAGSRTATPAASPRHHRRRTRRGQHLTGDRRHAFEFRPGVDRCRFTRQRMAGRGTEQDLPWVCQRPISVSMSPDGHRPRRQDDNERRFACRAGCARAPSGL